MDKTYIILIQTIIYYLILYLLIIVVSYFKNIREFKQQSGDTPEIPFNWRKVFFVSNEFIYTTSGVFIVLLEKQNTWIPPIVAGLLLIMLISTNLDAMSTQFSPKKQFRLHILVIGLIIGSTLITYLYELDKDKNNIEITKIGLFDSTDTFKINIPYTDKSLIKHFGYDKFGEKFLCYEVMIVSENKENAVKKAIDEFWADSTLQPILSSKNDKNLTLKINHSNIVIQLDKTNGNN